MTFLLKEKSVQAIIQRQKFYIYVSMCVCMAVCAYIFNYLYYYLQKY